MFLLLVLVLVMVLLVLSAAQYLWLKKPELSSLDRKLWSLRVPSPLSPPGSFVAFLTSSLVRLCWKPQSSSCSTRFIFDPCLHTHTAPFCSLCFAQFYCPSPPNFPPASIPPPSHLCPPASVHLHFFDKSADKKKDTAFKQTENFHFVRGRLVRVRVFAGHQSTGGSPGNQHFNSQAELTR